VRFSFSQLSIPKISFQESPLRRFLWLPVGYGLGIAFYFSLSQEPSLWIFWACFSVSLLCLVANRFSLKWYSIYFVAWIVMGIAMGGLRTYFLSTPMLSEIVKDQHFSGRIVQVEDKDDSYRLYLDQLDIDTLPLKKVRVRAAKSYFSENPPQEGDVIEGVMTLLPISGPVYPGGLDLRRQAFFEGISAYGSLKNLDRVEPKKTSSDGILWLRQLRSHINQQLLERIEKPYGSIAMALITGDRSLIPPVIRQHFVDAGTAHILAISGLHLSLIAGFVFLLIRGGLALIPSIAEKFPIKKIAAGVSIFITFLYLLISGVGYPAQRAFIMTTLVMVAIIVDRKAISMRTLALAAFVVLLVHPESLLTASFQLSFAAVIALIAFYEVGWKPLYEWSRYGGGARKIIAYFLGITLTTCVASLATTPFTIMFFNRFTLQAILGNILGIPLTGFLVMPLAFLSLLSLCFGGSSFLFFLFSKSLIVLCKSAEYVSSFPGAAILLPSPSVLYLVCIVSGGLWLCLWRTRLRLFGFVPLIGSLYFLIYPKLPTVLITPNVMAVRDGDTLHVSTQKSWFEVAMWQRHLGCKDVKLWEENVYGVGGFLLVKEPSKIDFSDLKRLAKKAEEQGESIITTGYFPRVLRGSFTKNNMPILVDKYAIQEWGGGIFVYEKDNLINKKFIFAQQVNGWGRPWSSP